MALSDIFSLDPHVIDLGKRVLKDVAPKPISDMVEGVLSLSNEPQRAYMWELTFQDPFESNGGVFGLAGYADGAVDSIADAITPDKPGIISDIVSGVRDYAEAQIDDFLGGGTGRNLRYYAKNTAIPSRTHQVIARHYTRSGYGYMGRDTTPKIFRATFWDSQALDAFRFFSTWIDYAQYGDERLKAHPVTYYRDITLKLKDTSNLMTTQQFKFKDAFPIEITEAALNYSDSSEFTFDVMFRFEKRVM
jgi:hypothetical protein